MEEKEKNQQEETVFFHPDLVEVPKDGSPPYLKGYRCKKCGNLDFPKPVICYKCWGEEFEIVPLSRKGKLYSFSDIYIGPPGYGQDLPYVIGYIDLPEGIRVFAQLEGEPGTFKCDEEVELTLGKIRKNEEGKTVISYKFKKVKN
jgi:benzoylsuccinyl-CoA thiolase BbsA subunit